MKMKKIFSIVLLVLLLVVPFALMTGCANNEDMLLQCKDENFGNYTGKTVDGLSAYDLVM